MFEKILVPLDGSKNAEMVLPYAEEIAGKFHSELKLIGVTEKENIPSPSTAPNTTDVLFSYLVEKVKQVTEQGRGFGIDSAQQITFKLLSGKVAQKILAYSEEINADLIALTSRGTSSQEKWVLGNVSAKILRATRKPVLIVRSAPAETALIEKNLVKRILLPLDGSVTGEAAIQITESLATHLDAQLTLFHVLEPIMKYGMYDTNAHYAIQDSLSDREAAARTYLNKVNEAIKERTGIVSSNVVIMGYPANEIASYSKNHDIDLIAMSTHGRSGLQHWVFGSVTDKTLHFGDTPVLVIRPNKN
jgi:nucleotide-binding universal stress UspA family protein